MSGSKGRSGNTFKETYGAVGTLTGGLISPEKIGIVGLPEDAPGYIAGVDVPLEDWNADLWDQARLAQSCREPVDPHKILATIEMGGTIPAIEITKRRGFVLTVEGRRRVLGSRLANRILVERGASVDSLIQIAAIPTKSTDLEVTVRIGNEGRLEDPPWVKAENAGQLRARGKTIQQIQAIFGVAGVITIHNWFHYLDLDEGIKARVRSREIPFAVGYEIGKLGKGERILQELALNYLHRSGAALKGEQGRENARAVVSKIQAGEIQGNPLEPWLPMIPAAVSPAESSPPAQEEGPESEGQPDKGKAPAPARGPRTRQAGALSGAKMSPVSIRKVIAALEPAPGDEPDPDPAYHDMDLAYRVLLVVTGQDATAEGLKPWPLVHACFSKVVSSPTVSGE